MDPSLPAAPDPNDPQYIAYVANAQLQAAHIEHQQREQELLTKLEATAQAELARKDAEHNANLQDQFHTLSNQFQVQWTEREANLRAEHRVKEEHYHARLQVLEDQLRMSSNLPQAQWAEREAALLAQQKAKEAEYHARLQTLPQPMAAEPTNQESPSRSAAPLRGRGSSRRAAARRGPHVAAPASRAESSSRRRNAASRAPSPTSGSRAASPTNRPSTPRRRAYKSTQSSRSKKSRPLSKPARLHSNQAAGEDDSMGILSLSDEDDDEDEEDEEGNDDDGNTQAEEVREKGKEKEAAKKKKRQAFQLKTVDLPRNIKGIKDSLMLHLRILWRLLDARIIPGKPSQDALDKFARRFTTEAALHVQTSSSNLLIAVSQVRGASFLANSVPPPAESDDAQKQQSKIYNAVRKMEDHIIHYIDVLLARFGFEEWCPDLTQSPYSLYNSACRIVALDTYKQAASSHAYAQLKPNLAYIHDLPLLMRIYDHFIFYYFQGRFNRNLKNPGIIQVLDDTNSLYHNRSRLAEARLLWLEENGYPERYQNLVSAKATSDDERDPAGSKVQGRPVHFIKTRPERSAAVTRFFRILDALREVDARHDPKRRWKERVRREPPSGHPNETVFPTIPTGMPVDYFDPDFFNSLQPRLRAKAAMAQVALLPDVEMSFTGHPDEKLSDSAFNRKYGDDVRLARYNLVTEADLMFPPEDSDFADDEEAENHEMHDDDDVDDD